jgi:hypothetical protein
MRALTVAKLAMSHAIALDAGGSKRGIGERFSGSGRTHGNSFNSSRPRLEGWRRSCSSSDQLTPLGVANSLSTSSSQGSL